MMMLILLAISLSFNQTPAAAAECNSGPASYSGGTAQLCGDLLRLSQYVGITCYEYCVVLSGLSSDSRPLSYTDKYKNWCSRLATQAQSTFGAPCNSIVCQEGVYALFDYLRDPPASCRRKCPEANTKGSPWTWKGIFSHLSGEVNFSGCNGLSTGTVSDSTNPKQWFGRTVTYDYGGQTVTITRAILGLKAWLYLGNAYEINGSPASEMSIGSDLSLMDVITQVLPKVDANFPVWAEKFPTIFSLYKRAEIVALVNEVAQGLQGVTTTSIPTVGVQVDFGAVPGKLIFYIRINALYDDKMRSWQVSERGHVPKRIE